MIRFDESCKCLQTQGYESIKEWLLIVKGDGARVVCEPCIKGQSFRSKMK